MGKQLRSWAIILVGVLIAAGISRSFVSQKAERNRSSSASSPSNPKGSPELPRDSTQTSPALPETAKRDVLGESPKGEKDPLSVTGISNLPRPTFQNPSQTGLGISSDARATGPLHPPILDWGTRDYSEPHMKLAPDGFSSPVLQPSFPRTYLQGSSKPGLKIEMDPLGGRRFYPPHPNPAIPDSSPPRTTIEPSR